MDTAAQMCRESKLRVPWAGPRSARQCFTAMATEQVLDSKRADEQSDIGSASRPQRWATVRLTGSPTRLARPRQEGPAEWSGTRSCWTHFSGSVRGDGRRTSVFCHDRLLHPAGTEVHSQTAAEFSAALFEAWKPLPAHARWLEAVDLPAV